MYIAAFSSILPDSHQNNRQKTRVVKKTANPVFNHIMVYDGLRAEDLKDTCIELTVWDHDRLSNNFLGGTRLGLGTGGRHLFLALTTVYSQPDLIAHTMWRCNVVDTTTQCFIIF